MSFRAYFTMYNHESLDDHGNPIEFPVMYTENFERVSAIVSLIQRGHRTNPMMVVEIDDD